MISVFRIMSLCCVNVKTFIHLFTVEKVYKNHIVTSVFKPQQKKPHIYGKNKKKHEWIVFLLHQSKTDWSYNDSDDLIRGKSSCYTWCMLSVIKLFRPLLLRIKVVIFFAKSRSQDNTSIFRFIATNIDFASMDRLCIYVWWYWKQDNWYSLDHFNQMGKNI